MPDQISIIKDIISERKIILNNDVKFKQILLEILENVKQTKNIIDIKEDSDHPQWKREHYFIWEILYCFTWDECYLENQKSQKHFTQTSVQQAIEDTLAVLQQ